MFAAEHMDKEEDFCLNVFMSFTAIREPLKDIYLMDKIKWRSETINTCFCERKPK